MFSKLLAFATSFLIVLTCVGQEQLLIKVTNAQQETLGSATVSIGQQKFSTNQQGEVLIKNLEKKKYQLTVSHLGYHVYQTQVNPGQQQVITIRLKEFAYQADEITIDATRAKKNGATTMTNLDKTAIRNKNLGQDIPYLLDQTPGVVIGSDAGAGIGYTNMTIRGSDNERINVTLNGIPLNNSESLGSFFVNLPDFASNAQSIQIQRGIGTSTNGAGAFGASINIQTDALESAPYAELNNSFGSFNSWKNTVKVGTGLIHDKYAVNARLSRISSDGFIERASSDLKSFYVDAGMYTDRHTLKATIFSGKEKTYQAWNGVPEPLFTGKKDRMDEYAAMMELSDPKDIARFMAADRRYNLYDYDNQTDNYTQTHSHLQYTFQVNQNTTLNTSLHYTRGAGYYEEYKKNDAFAKYGLSNVFVDGVLHKKSDLIRQRWLDNYFYGITYALQHKASENLNFTFGGAYNQYIGGHFGEVLWTQYNAKMPKNHRYYYNEGHKNDFNFYAKADYRQDQWLFNIDLQYRNIYYKASGDEDKRKDMYFKDDLNFFNPKAGITYLLSEQANIYASYAYASKEPVREDYVNNLLNTFPKPEKMQDIEAGYRFSNENLLVAANLYAMLYKDQLIPTGKLNDVGSALRMNVKDSYRIGAELNTTWNIDQQWQWGMTAAFSQNKIKNFTEVLSVYDNATNWTDLGEKEIFYKSTTIAKSPSAVLSNNFTYKPTNALSFSLLSKYISRIYLDNSSNQDRSLKPSFVNHIQGTYAFSAFGLERIELNALVSNIFNSKYATSGYTFGQYFQDNGHRDYYNFYYPQAGTNFLLGLNIRF